MLISICHHPQNQEVFTEVPLPKVQDYGTKQVRRSTVAANLVGEITKRKLLVPTCTRWNSYYDAVVRITENSIAELNELCARMELHCFGDREIIFLKEYCAILKPFARGLDILQLFLWHSATNFGKNH